MATLADLSFTTRTGKPGIIRNPSASDAQAFIDLAEEGRQIKDMKYADGTYIDTVLMGKFVK